MKMTTTPYENTVDEELRLRNIVCVKKQRRPFYEEED